MRFPRARDNWLRPILVTNLCVEVLIVVTGGIVRLTGSGLGCPTWPECVPGSFTPVPHQEQGFHKYIEFGNRTLTGLVGIVALISLWALWSRWPKRRRPQLLAWATGAGIIAEAVVGGVTVRTGLNPWFVAFHFLASMVLIALATLMLRACADDPGRDGGDPSRTLEVAPMVRSLAVLTAALAAAVLVLGTIVTGSGPHSGDAAQPARTGFDPRFVSWMHADTVMLFCGLVIGVLVAVHVSTAPERARSAWRTLLVITLAQGLIGYVQYFTRLPEVLVLAHMLGASLLAIAMTSAVANLWRNPV